jgi:hypothetical protein
MALGTAFSSGFGTGGQVATNIGNLQQRKQEFEQTKRNQFLTDYQKRVAEAAKQIDTAVKGIYTSSPNPEEDIQKLKAGSQPIVQGLLKAGQLLGTDPAIVQQTFENVFAQPSPTKIAEQAAEGKGLEAEAIAEETGKLKTFIDPKGVFHSIRATNNEAIDTALNAGWVEAPVRFEGKEKITKAKVASGEALGAVQTGAAAIKALRDVPGAVGLPGAITENIGGFFGSIGLKSTESAISNFFSGEDPEKVKAARSKFITFQGSMARAILNDTRISDFERRILNEAIGATGPTASDTALIGAYKNILATSTTLARRKQGEAGENVLDLTSPDEINILGKQLVNAGLTNEDAVDVIKQILDIEAIQL